MPVVHWLINAPLVKSAHTLPHRCKHRVGEGCRGYRLILELEVQDGLSLLVVLGDLRRLPHVVGVRDPDPGPLPRGRSNTIIIIIIIIIIGIFGNCTFKLPIF